MPATFPNTSDVTSFLTVLGISIPGGYDVSLELQAVIDQVEEITGWRPFLKGATDQTRKFDPAFSIAGGPMIPNGGVILPLRGGLLECTSVKIGSRTLTRNTEYWTEPSHMSPWTRIRFNTIYWSKPQMIEITGKWGYSETIPADLFVAIRDLTAYQILSNIKANQVMSGIESWKEGDVTENFSANQIEITLKAKQAAFEQACMKYRRVTG